MCGECDKLQSRLATARELWVGLSDLGTVALLKADIAELEALLVKSEAGHPTPYKE
jgi:hypothetical protein